MEIVPRLFARLQTARSNYSSATDDDKTLYEDQINFYDGMIPGMVFFKENHDNTLLQGHMTVYGRPRRLNFDVSHKERIILGLKKALHACFSARNVREFCEDANNFVPPRLMPLDMVHEYEGNVKLRTEPFFVDNWTATFKAHVDNLIVDALSYRQLWCIMERLGFTEERMGPSDLLNATKTSLRFVSQFPIMDQTGPLVLFSAPTDTEGTLTHIVQSGPASQYTVELMTNMRRSLNQLLLHDSDYVFEHQKYRALLAVCIMCDDNMFSRSLPLPSTRKRLIMMYRTPLSFEQGNLLCEAAFFEDGIADGKTLHAILLKSYFRQNPLGKVVFWDRASRFMPLGNVNYYIMLPAVTAALKGVFLPNNQFSIDNCYKALTGNADRYHPDELPIYTAQRVYVIFAILTKCCDVRTDKYKRNVSRLRKLIIPSANDNAMAAICQMDPLAAAQALSFLQRAQAQLSGQTPLLSNNGFVDAATVSVTPNYTGLRKLAEMRVTASQIETMKQYMQGSVNLTVRD